MQLPGLVAVVTFCSLLAIIEALPSTNDSLLRLLVKILQEDVDEQKIEKRGLLNQYPSCFQFLKAFYVIGEHALGMNPNYSVWEQTKFQLDKNEDRLDRLMNEVAKIPNMTHYRLKDLRKMIKMKKTPKQICKYISHLIPQENENGR